MVSRRTFLKTFAASAVVAAFCRGSVHAAVPYDWRAAIVKANETLFNPGVDLAKAYRESAFAAASSLDWYL